MSADGTCSRRRRRLTVKEVEGCNMGGDGGGCARAGVVRR